VCDKAGECPLQDNYFRYSNQPSRFVEHKETKLKTYDLGPQIIYDGERCINCTRCIRFMDEVALDSQLGQVQRGDRSTIATAEGKSLDHPYAMNVVDLCPVGALLGKDFRFQVRAWFLKSHPSVCPGCARGCNVFVDATDLNPLVHRIRPRDNPHVNGPWMCDEGRWTYHRARDRRFTRATTRDGSDHRALSADVAVRRAAELLRPWVGSPDLAVTGSAHLTCEDHLVLGLLARDALRAPVLGLHGHAPWAGDTFLKLADRNPNRRGALAVHQSLGRQEVVGGGQLLADMESGKVKALLMVGTELPTTDVDRLRAALSRLQTLVVLGSESGPATEVAHLALPVVHATEADGLWLNGFGRAQRVRPATPPPGDAAPAWRVLSLVARDLGLVLNLDTGARVLESLGAAVPAFRGLTHDGVGLLGTATAGETTAPRRVGEGKPPEDYPAFQP
jgi:NADH-quinone oxidoreductase subunit G